MALALSACTREGGKATDKTTPDRPGKGIMIYPDAATPGSEVFVRPSALDPGTKPEAVKVSVGGMPALVEGVATRAGVVFLVPRQKPGTHEVVLSVPGHPPEATKLTVLPPQALHLVLRMTGKRVELLSERGASGLARTSREFPEGPPLAYDVLTDDAVLVATGVMSHPLKGRREVFEKDGTMHGVAKAPESAVFSLRIPAVARGGIVRFFEADEEVDLETPNGRESRRQVAELRVQGVGQ